ncbi:type IV pilus twitching motility protein PilT [Leucobacter weissii]|uniref:Type IV pilus twitching motility protein PilT n=2 Tax=Leucobacter weissii TaxID=1983706 RepID=A0A939MMD6_9MICO|nr:type IV pilus twitching motility protein PilT [Leucobacter weissii]MBO1901116.1 type IV pilus twitching motility protein PilT [Leucobacter weissii]
MRRERRRESLAAETAPGGLGAGHGLRGLLETAHRSRASDVHLTEGLPPQMRVDGDLVAIPGGEQPLSREWFQSALAEMMTPQQLEDLAGADELDFSVAVAGLARFRVNVFRQLGSLAAAMRFIPDEAKPLEELGVPAIAADLAVRPRGLVIVTGPTGSGKSTTLAAMIDLVNRRLPAHVVTIEDPVEFRHESKTALIHQREVGSDTRSFAEAMRRVLRQDPDIILIGELRDPESIATALTAAETGHLVLSTLHTQSAAKSINRIVDAFPPAQQQQVRTQLGDTLQGIITQTLLPKAVGHGRLIATEVLVNTPAIANLIREGEVSQIYSMIQAGRSLGMHTLDQDLKRLVEQGEITLELAQSRAQDPKSIVEGVRVRSGLREDAWMGEMGNQQSDGWAD